MEFKNNTNEFGQNNDAQKGDIKVHKFNTKGLERKLKEAGFKTVDIKAEHTEVNIFIEEKKIELPLQVEGTSGMVYAMLAKQMLASAGIYSEMSQRVALGHAYAEGKPLPLRVFSQVVPKVVNKQRFLPKAFEKANDEGRLHVIAKRAAPYQLRAVVKFMDIPTIELKDINEDNFKSKTGLGMDELDAPFSQYEFLVNSKSDYDRFVEAGAQPHQLWTVDRIVAELTLSGGEMTLADMHNLLPGSKLEKNTLTFVAGDTDWKVEIGPDPNYISEAEDADRKVWLVDGNPVLDNQYVPGFGVVHQSRAVWTMIQTMTSANSEPEVRMLLQKDMSNMTVRDLYDYAFCDKSYTLMAKNAVSIFKIISAQDKLSPMVVKVRNSDDIAEAALWFATNGIASITDAQVKTLYVGDGARMRMFDIRLVEDQDGNKYWEIVNVNDGSKPSKLTNRGGLCSQQQAYVLKGGTNTFFYPKPDNQDDAFKNLLIESGMRVKVGSNGSVARSGILMDAALTNWIGENGSGVATIRPDVVLQLAVNKREKFFEAAQYCHGENPDAYVAKHLTFAEVGKHVWPGDAIAWFRGVPIARFGNEDKGAHGQIMEITPPKVENVHTNADGEPITFDLSGSISIVTTYPEVAMKFRAPGIKAAVWQEKLNIIDDNGNSKRQPDVLFGTENQKQDDNKITARQMYADTCGPVVYDLVQGIFLDGHEEKFQEWYTNNLTYEWIWTVDSLIEKDYWAIKKDNQNSPDFQWDDANHRFGQRCTVLRGKMVLSVEVSTVLENMGVQAQIGEQMAALATIHRPLARKLWDDNAPTRKAIWSMLAMAKGDVPELVDPSHNPFWGSSETSPVDISFPQDLLEKKGPKAVFRYMEQKFPTGLFIEHNNDDVVLMFDALAHFSTPADRIGNSSLRLLQHASIPVENRDQGWGSVLTRLIKMIKSALSRWVSAPGVLKGLTRSEKVMFGRKIKTVNRAVIKPGQIGLNPNDPLVKKAQKDMERIDRKLEELLVKVGTGEITQEDYDKKQTELNAKRKGLFKGDSVLLSRSPMISVVCLDVVITERAPIGTFLVYAYDWHRGNEGDGDGDGSAALRIPKDMVNAVRIAVSRSVFGPMGYDIAWGTTDISKHPYMDFYRDYQKKSLAKALGKPSTMDINTYAKTLKQIGSHYTLFVGKSFAMASALTFKVDWLNALEGMLAVKPEMFADPDSLRLMLDQHKGYATACAKVWRRVYEGLALSGISDQGLFAAEQIGRIGAQNMIVVSQKPGEGLHEMLREAGFIFKVFIDSTDNTTELASFKGDGAVKVLFHLLGIQLSDDEAKAIHWSIVVTSLYSKLEARHAMDTEDMFEQTLPKWIQELPYEEYQSYKDDATVFGSLRRCGAGLWENSRYEDGTSLVSMTNDNDINLYHPGVTITGAILWEGARALRKIKSMIDDVRFMQQQGL